MKANNKQLVFGAIIIVAVLAVAFTLFKATQSSGNVSPSELAQDVPKPRAGSPTFTAGPGEVSRPNPGASGGKAGALRSGVSDPAASATPSPGK